MIGKTISHYRVIEELGRGGMGVVYKAEDTKLKRTVAIKFLPPELTRDEEARNRFIHEAQAASALEHHNICNIHEIDQTKPALGEPGVEQLFVVMACYEGEILKEKIKRNPLKIEEALDIAIQISQGLNEAHEKGIIHRDIKPSNIFITTDGIVKIIDFGLAKLAGKTVITKEGTTLGTVNYMSPEQTRGEEVDYRTDIWSLGVVLYEIITGQLPFKGNYDQAVVYSIMNEEPEPLTGLRSGVPIELERIVQKSLAKVPNERYQHTDELLTDLKNLQRTLLKKLTISQSLKSAGAAIPKKVTGGKKKFTIKAAIILSIITIVSLIWYLLSNKISQPEPIIEKSIAVLPFTAITQAEEDVIFSDGIHDDIITQLAKIKDLKVIARTSVQGYRQTPKRIRDIAKELGVGSILEGSVRRSGHRIRIVAQLIDGNTENHLWAESYDRDYKDIFAIQSEIAGQIALALKAQLTRQESDLIAQKPTSNMEAYDFYLKGNYYWENFDDLQGNLKAAEMYEKAVSLDPQFGLAYAQMSKVYFVIAKVMKYNEFTLTPKALKALEKSIEIIPDHPLTYLAQEYYFRLIELDLNKSLELLNKAIELNPNNAEIYGEIGVVLTEMRRVGEALIYFKKQYELNPLDPFSGLAVARIFLFLRQWQEAESWFDRSIPKHPRISWGYRQKSQVFAYGYGDLDTAIDILDEGLQHVESRRDDLHWLKWNYLLLKRDYQEAMQLLQSELSSSLTYPLAMAFNLNLLNNTNNISSFLDSATKRFKKEIEQSPDDAFMYSNLGFTYAMSGKKVEALSFARKAVRLEPIESDYYWNGETRLLNLAYILIIFGEYDEACEHLKTLLNITSQLTVWMLKLDPLFDPIRDQPCFQRLLRAY